MAAAGDPPATPPAADPGTNPPVNPQDPPAAPAANDQNAQRRIIESLQQQVKGLTDAVTKLTATPPAKEDPKPAEPPSDPLQQLRAELAEMRAEQQRGRQEALRSRIAAEAGIPPEHIDLIDAADEAGMRAKAERLKPLVGRAPIQGGSITNPGGAGAPSIDDQIEQARKAGDKATEVRLARQKAFGAR